MFMAAFVGPDIVVHPVVVDFCAAGVAGIGIVARVGVADADFGLDVPVGMYGPGVAVGDSTSGEPALHPLVAQFAEICAEHVEVEVYVTCVVLAAVCLDAEEMAGEAAAEPVACFGLHKPVFPFVVVDGPKVHLAGDVEAPFRGESYLNSEIGA